MTTPTTIINKVQAIRDQFADKLTPDGLAAFDAVIAMARCDAELDNEFDDAVMAKLNERRDAALSAAGVGGGE